LSCLALWLFGAEKVLVAACRLAVGVLGALGVAGPRLVHVHLVLDIPLQASNETLVISFPTAKPRCGSQLIFSDLT